MTDVIMTAVIVAAGTALNIVAAIIREDRKRKWDLEDRRLVLAEARAHAEGLAAGLAKESAAQAGRLLGRIAENTEISQSAVDRADAAYHEANTVNRKIAEVGLKVADGSLLSPNERG